MWREDDDIRLAPDQDAYGHAILDYHERGEGYEITEHDDGWMAPSGGPTAYFRGYEDWSDRELAAMEHVHGRVLDNGCGAGGTRSTSRNKVTRSSASTARRTRLPSVGTGGSTISGNSASRTSASSTAPSTPFS